MIKIKLNTDLNGRKKGQIITVSDNDMYWKRRINDSIIDNCVEIIDDAKNKNSSLIDDTKRKKVVVRSESKVELNNKKKETELNDTDSIQSDS